MKSRPATVRHSVKTRVENGRLCMTLAALQCLRDISLCQFCASCAAVSLLVSVSALLWMDCLPS